MSTATIHPQAPHHLPMFITAPGETDVAFNVMIVFLIVMVLAVIIFYFTLHSLPERIAHKGQKIQFEIVAILALISLFTHNHFFWIAGLLLAFIPLPDFSTPLERMADSLGRMAGWRKRTPDADAARSDQREEALQAAIDDLAAGSAQRTAGSHETQPAARAEVGSTHAPTPTEATKRVRSISKESA
jgi:hypothetical protein